MIWRFRRLEKAVKVFYNLTMIADEKNGGMSMEFLASMAGYLGHLVFYAALAVLGVIAGKKLSDNKKAKNASKQSEAKTEE